MDKFKKLLKFAIEKQAVRIRLCSGIHPSIYTESSEDDSLEMFELVTKDWLGEVLSQIFSDPALVKQAQSGSRTEGKFSIRGIGKVFTASFASDKAFELNLFFGEKASKNFHDFWQTLDSSEKKEESQVYGSNNHVANVFKQVPPLPQVFQKPPVQSSQEQEDSQSHEEASLAGSFDAAASQQFAKMGEKEGDSELGRMRDRRQEERVGEDGVSYTAIAYSGEDDQSASFLSDTDSGEEALNFSAIPSQYSSYESLVAKSKASQQASELSKTASDDMEDDVLDSEDDGRESQRYASQFPSEPQENQERRQRRERRDEGRPFSRLSFVDSASNTQISKQQSLSEVTSDKQSKYRFDMFSAGDKPSEIRVEEEEEGREPSADREPSAKYDREPSASRDREPSAEREPSSTSMYGKAPATSFHKDSTLKAQGSDTAVFSVNDYKSSEEEVSFTDSGGAISEYKMLGDASIRGDLRELEVDVDSLPHTLPNDDESLMREFSASSQKDIWSEQSYQDADTDMDRGSLSSDFAKEFSDSVPSYAPPSDTSEKAGLDVELQEGERKSALGKRLGVLSEMLEQFVQHEIKIAYFSSQKRMFYKKNESLDHFSGASFEAGELLELFSSDAPDNFHDLLESEGSLEYMVPYDGVNRFYVHISSVDGEVHVLMKDLMAFSWNALASELNKTAMGNLSVVAKDLVDDSKSGGMYLLSSYGYELSETLGYALCEQALNTHAVRLMVISGAAFYPLKTLRGGSVYQKHVTDKSQWFEALDLAKEDHGLDILFISRMSLKLLGTLLPAYLLPLSRRGVKVIVNMSEPSSYYAFSQMFSHKVFSEKPYLHTLLASELKYVLAACQVQLDSGKKNTLLEAAPVSERLAKVIALAPKGFKDSHYYQRWLDGKWLTLDEQVFSLVQQGVLDSKRASWLSWHPEFYQSLVRLEAEDSLPPPSHHPSQRAS